VEQAWKKRMVSIDPKKSVAPVRPAAEPNRLELAQLVLNGRKGKSTHPHQLADVTLLLRCIEKQLQ